MLFLSFVRCSTCNVVWKAACVAAVCGKERSLSTRYSQRAQRQRQRAGQPEKTRHRVRTPLFLFVTLSLISISFLEWCKFECVVLKRNKKCSLLLLQNRRTDDHSGRPETASLLLQQSYLPVCDDPLHGPLLHLWLPSSVGDAVAWPLPDVYHFQQGERNVFKLFEWIFWLTASHMHTYHITGGWFILLVSWLFLSGGGLFCFVFLRCGSCSISCTLFTPTSPPGRSRGVQPSTPLLSPLPCLVSFHCCLLSQHTIDWVTSFLCWSAALQ